MFELSTNVTTSIAIYPNSIDSWDVLSPFPGETLNVGEIGFVLSNSLINNCGLLHLIPKRLVDVGVTSNEINFLVKTNLKQKTVLTSDGIGGTSKLKDFEFSITKDYLGTNPMDNRDILNLYGRKVVLFISNSLCVEDPNGVLSEISYTGSIFNAVPKDHTIIFGVRGLLDNANPSIGGAVVTQSDGSQQNEALIFGDTGDIYLPISKKENENGITTLQFSNDNYIIKSLHVKAGTDKEIVWLDIETPFTIIDNEIKFNSIEVINTTLSQNVLGTGLQGDIVRLEVNTFSQVGFKLKTEYIDPLVPGDYLHFYGERDSPYKIFSFGNRVQYIRTETVEDEQILLCKCGWEFTDGQIRRWIEDGAFAYGGVTYEPNFLMPNGSYHDIEYAVTYTKNPLEKQIDCLPYFAFGGSGLDDPWPWEPGELKDTINLYAVDYHAFEQIPEEPLLIQINDEKFLVLYTEKNTYEPTSEQNINHPIQQFVWVARGWNNTSIQSHSSGDGITILTDFEQKIEVKLVRTLKGITTLNPGGDWKYYLLQDFINGINPMVACNLGGGGSTTGKQSSMSYIGLDWKLPDLSGDLYALFMEGKAEAKIDSSSIGDSVRKHCFINLAFNSIETGDETRVEDIRLARRRVMGHRYSEDIHEQDKFKISGHYYDPPPSSNSRLLNGQYKLNLKESRSWYRDVFGTSDSQSGFSKISNLYDISDYDELKETSMYVVFNSVNIRGHKSTFVLHRPNLIVYLKKDLSSSDVYAKVISKSLFNHPSAQITCGSNCKIAWHPYNYINDKVDVNIKNTIAVSDDDVIGFTLYKVLPEVSFAWIMDNPNVDIAGTMVENLVRPNDISKIYPSIAKKESLILPLSDPDNFVRTSEWPNGLLDIGKTFIENNNSYIWVDQTNNRIKIIPKVITTSNPVDVIQLLISTYYSSVNIDTTAFDEARNKRVDWNSRLLVLDETPLVSSIDLLAKNHGLIVYENNLGEMSISALDPPSDEEVTYNIDDSMILYDNNKKPDFKENFTFIDYIITEMDVYYDFNNNKYLGYIKSDELSNSDDFIIAQQFTENTIKIKLELKTIFDKGTANKSSEIKMLYHQVPTRIVVLKTSLATASFKIGQWVTCTSSFINEMSGKIFLILGKQKQVPFPEKTPYIKLTLFEFDWDDLKLRIQEVPSQSINDNYDEIIDYDEKIDEVPNT